MEVLQAMLEAKLALGMMNVPCWPYSGSAFRTAFAKLVSDLEISDLQFKPYSLRRGGATFWTATAWVDGASFGERQMENKCSCEIVHPWRFEPPSFTRYDSFCQAQSSEIFGSFHCRAPQFSRWEPWKEEENTMKLQWKIFQFQEGDVESPILPWINFWIQVLPWAIKVPGWRTQSFKGFHDPLSWNARPSCVA